MRNNNDDRISFERAFHGYQARKRQLEKCNGCKKKEVAVEVNWVDTLDVVILNYQLIKKQQLTIAFIINLLFS